MDYRYLRAVQADAQHTGRPIGADQYQSADRTRAYISPDRIDPFPALRAAIRNAVATNAQPDQRHVRPARQVKHDSLADAQLHLATLQRSSGQKADAIAEQEERVRLAREASQSRFVAGEERRMRGVPDSAETPDQTRERLRLERIINGEEARRRSAPDARYPVTRERLAKLAGCSYSAIERGERPIVGRRLPPPEAWYDPPQGGRAGSMAYYSLWHVQRVISIRAKPHVDPGPDQPENWVVPREWIELTG